MLKIAEVYKGANIYKSEEEFILIYENSKKMIYTADRDTYAGIEGTPIFIRQLKRCNSLKTAKAFITRNKRFYAGYQLNHSTGEREDIYHRTEFF